MKSDIVTYLDKDVLKGLIVKRVSKIENSLLAFASSKFSTTFFSAKMDHSVVANLLAIFSKPRNFALNR